MLGLGAFAIPSERTERIKVIDFVRVDGNSFLTRVSADFLYIC